MTFAKIAWQTLFIHSTVVSHEGMNDSLWESEVHSRMKLQCNRILTFSQEPTYKNR